MWSAKRPQRPAEGVLCEPVIGPELRVVDSRVMPFAGFVEPARAGSGWTGPSSDFLSTLSRTRTMRRKSRHVAGGRVSGSDGKRRKVAERLTRRPFRDA
jgi:hypothetical protein